MDHDSRHVGYEEALASGPTIAAGGGADTDRSLTLPKLKQSPIQVQFPRQSQRSFPIRIGLRSLVRVTISRFSGRWWSDMACLNLVVFCGLLTLVEPCWGTDRPASDPIVATVNGGTIRESEVSLACLIRGISDADRPQFQAQLIEQLTTQKLMADFLKQQRVEATPEEVDLRVTLISDQIRQAGREPKEVFAKLGLSEAIIRQTVALPLAWRRYARQSITDAQVEEHFQKYRPRFDGTRVHASQIVLKRMVHALPESSAAVEEQQALTKRLEQLRGQIVAGEITFSEAAKQHSESPTSAQGGDLGAFSYGTQVAKEIADAAFTLKEGEVSGIVITRHGVHLVQTTKIEPGQYSLGDVRQELLYELTEQLWRNVSEKLRAEAKVEIK